MRRLIDRFPLQRGAHPSRDDGMCAMEMVAWLAGEAHSDEPECACPVVASFVRACNDAMGDRSRNRWLRPLVPQLVRTRATPRVEQQRGLLAIDAMLHELLPLWRSKQGRDADAAALRQGPVVARAEDLPAACRAVLEHARDLVAARWVVKRALGGMPPAGYVTGVVHAAAAVPGELAWPILAGMIRRMVAVGEQGYCLDTVRSPGL